MSVGRAVGRQNRDRKQITRGGRSDFTRIDITSRLVQTCRRNFEEALHAALARCCCEQAAENDECLVVQYL